MPYISKNITKQELDFYKKIIGELNVVFDIGTQRDNPFYYLKPSLEIHLFEPVKNYTDSIAADLKGKEHNVYINNFALGSTEEMKEFWYQYGTWRKKDKPRFKNMQDTYEVQVKTLNDYCKQRGITKIDYLKIDTEGFDFEVIKGGSELLDGIRFIQFEDFNVFYNGETVKDIFEYFEGWNVYKIGGKPCNYLVSKEIVDLEVVR